jgi:leader peptidase (prepilin peptidase) / N-methyltransferase
VLFEMSGVVLGGIGFFSLFIGGFLAVLIYRLPLILYAVWRAENPAMVMQEGLIVKPFNLWLPASHCPYCKQTLRFLERLPVASYIVLKGKCAYCSKKIHPRYLWIELITCLSSSLVAYRFNMSVQMAMALFLTWGLIVLSGIDLEQSLLPDVLVLPLLWLGLIVNAFHMFTTPESAILGASLAYLSLWLLAKSFYYFTKREGMGQGDFKCFALLGAWLGWCALIYILLIASLLGLLVACILLIKRKNNFHSALPFGPYLAVAGWLVLLMNEKMAYFI